MNFGKGDTLQLGVGLGLKIDDYYNGFDLLYKETALPGPGAMNYAYMSLALGMFSPIGRATQAMGAIKAFATGQVMGLQTQSVNGIATTAGQMALQPLINPRVAS
jgi:hypothetical protein